MGNEVNNKVLVITSSDSSQDEIYSVVKGVLLELGIDEIELTLGEKDFMNSMRLASLIIADVSNQNSNVIYNLGKAVSLKKPTVLLLNIETKEKLPSDLYNQVFLTYEPDNLGKLRDKLKKIISEKIYSYSK